MAEFLTVDGHTICVSETRSVWHPIIILCRNRRVKHLYQYGKTARVRKKNHKRSIDLGLEWLCEVNNV